jgi:hypothetical protein
MGTATATGRARLDAILAAASTRGPVGNTTSILPEPGEPATTPTPNCGWVIRSPAAYCALAAYGREGFEGSNAGATGIGVGVLAPFDRPEEKLRVLRQARGASASTVSFSLR